MSDCSWSHGLQHARLPCPTLSPRVCSNSCPLSRDATQPSQPLSPPSHPAFSLSQYQGIFQWIGFSHQVAKILELQLQHQSFQCIFRVEFLEASLVWFPFVQWDSQESSLASQFESISSLALSLLCRPTFTSVHDCWKNCNFDYMDLCQQSDISAF